MCEITEEVRLLLLDYAESFHRFERELPPSLQLIADYENITTAQHADAFFETYGIGDALIGAHYPFERAMMYEQLLYLLKKHDPVQYNLIHKGTPFYFIGITAFKYKDYSKSLAYLNSAVSEDLRLNPGMEEAGVTTPAVEFMLLTPQRPLQIGIQQRVGLRRTFQQVLQQFQTDSNFQINVDDIITKFIAPLIFNTEHIEPRSIVTNLYLFLLERNIIERIILLRSNRSGAIDPFIRHLFDGARILESILEVHGIRGNDLRQKLNNCDVINIKTPLRGNNNTFLAALEKQQSLKESDASFIDQSFIPTYMIRIMTGHHLLRDDIFTDVENYRKLYNSIVNSILWTILKLYIKE